MLYGIVGVTDVEKQWWETRVLAQARLTKTGQIHTRALTQAWARHLAHAREARLSENVWRLWLVAAVFSPSEGLCLWARGGLPQARRGSPKWEFTFQQPSLLVFSPKRGPTAWAKEPFAWVRVPGLSEVDACIGVMFVVFYILTGDLLHNFITLFKAWMS